MKTAVMLNSVVGPERFSPPSNDLCQGLLLRCLRFPECCRHAVLLPEKFTNPVMRLAFTFGGPVGGLSPACFIQHQMKLLVQLFRHRP
jgi:hypothetical protein